MRHDGPAQGTLAESEIAALPEVCRPRALGAVPRLGLGSRTTVLGWATIFRFLSDNGLFANAVQNSVARELMPLSMLQSNAPRPSAYLPGLGPVDVGHTGSTIEGLVRWGMVSARDAGYHGPGYGADADHLPVHDPAGDQWAKTKQLIECSRDYSYFTLDVGPVVRWQEEPIERLRKVPECVVAAVEAIRAARNNAAADLEVSLDESSEGVSPEDATTRPEEIEWVLARLAEQDVQISYVAPHLGFHKGGDAVGADGQARLRLLASELARIATGAGALLSIHSGDHLSRETRRTLGEACGGKLLFKVAPAIQDLFIGAVFTHDPSLAGQWAEFVECMGVGDTDFRKHAFAAFGRTDERGEFSMRQRLYAANEAARTAFTEILRGYLEDMRADLGIAACQSGPRNV